MMKKSLLALAVAALSANAFAVDLDNTATPGTQVFAKEIQVAAAGTDIGGTAVFAQAKAGFALTSGFIRFDLDNGAKFKANPTLDVGTGGTAFTQITAPASGGAGQSFVIFKVEETGKSIATDAVVKLTTTGAGITVVNKNAVGVTFGLYETAGGAAQKAGALNAKSGTLLNFADAVKVSAAADAGKLKIDAISSESKRFAGKVDTTTLVKLDVALNTPTPLKTDGSGAVALTDVIKDTEWNVLGNFSAVKASGLTATDTATIAENKQSVKLAKTGGVTGSQTLSYLVTGAIEIPETSISATFTPVAQTGYVLGASTFENITKLEKNGTTRSADLVLNPNGVYSNFVRITNKDTITGAFFLKVINDNGQSVSFPLSDVAGQPATLAAGASTAQMTIQQIYAAAAAKGLNVGEGKLRLEVTGQTNDLSVQTYTVSKDGNSFATF